MGLESLVSWWACSVTAEHDVPAFGIHVGLSWCLISSVKEAATCIKHVEDPAHDPAVEAAERLTCARWGLAAQCASTRAPSCARASLDLASARYVDPCLAFGGPTSLFKNVQNCSLLARIHVQPCTTKAYPGPRLDLCTGTSGKHRFPVGSEMKSAHIAQLHTWQGGSLS